MRNIINISLPPTLTKKVEDAVRMENFASKSEFFRHLLREWMAGRLAQEFEEGRKEYRTRKTKRLNSMKALWR